ncbi:MAG: hypothetical protein WBF39_11430, partial [Planococcus donghaensis]
MEAKKDGSGGKPKPSFGRFAAGCFFIDCPLNRAHVAFADSFFFYSSISIFCVASAPLKNSFEISAIVPSSS